MTYSSGPATAAEPGNTKAPFTGANITVTPVPVDQLSPYPGNARKHSRKQIRLIADSIARFGFNNPVLIDDDGMIIAGHGRVAAAKQLNLVAVPTIRLSHLLEVDKRAYILAENKLAERAGWDQDILAIELQGLIDVDFDLELTGFQMSEIDIILDSADKTKRNREEFQDDAPEHKPGQPVTRNGDLWILGSHRVLCGDARDDRAYQALLGPDEAELVFTDPPYNVQINGHVCGLARFDTASLRWLPEKCPRMNSRLFEINLPTPGCTHDGSLNPLYLYGLAPHAEIMAAGNGTYSELKNLLSGPRPMAEWGASIGASTS